MKKYQMYAKTIIMSLLASCGDPVTPPDDTPYTAKTAPGLDGIRVSWDYSTLTQLAPSGTYARIKLLDDGSLVAVYGTSGAWLKKSTDKGATWGIAEQIVPNCTIDGIQISAANSEFIQLSDGTQMYAINYRPGAEGVIPWSIAISRSTDKGKTWSTAKVIYEADKISGNGCWEPCFLELPNGTVQIYFANENPYRNSSEQEITMLSSSDKGATWSEPQTVSFRAGKRDGMPVPAIFGDEIVVAIEDNGGSTFKPYTVRTTIADSWKSGFVSASSSKRERVLPEIPDIAYVGAPYLISIPGGSMMSYQTTEGRPDEGTKSCTMEVAIGNSTARNFSYKTKTRPFNIPIGKVGLWNSLCAIDDNTVMAVTASDYQGRNSPWAIKGYLIPSLIAKRSSISVDGNITEKEWGSYLPVFVGHKGNANIRAAVGRDNTNLYFCAKTNGAETVTFYLDAKNTCYAEPHDGVYRVKCDSAGRLSVSTGHKGKWKERELDGIECNVKSNGVARSVEVSVPLTFVEGDGEKIMRFAVSFTTTGSGNYTETVANANGDMPYTWCKMEI